MTHCQMNWCHCTTLKRVLGTGIFQLRLLETTRSRILVALVVQDTETVDATHKEIVASFLNALAGCLLTSQPLLELECYSTRTWNAASAHNALPGSSVMCKPDLVLSDDVTTKWGNIKVSGELTHSPYMPVMRLGKAADTHAYLMMSEQPWRRFAGM